MDIIFKIADYPSLENGQENREFLLYGFLRILITMTVTCYFKTEYVSLKVLRLTIDPRNPQNFSTSNNLQYKVLLKKSEQLQYFVSLCSKHKKHSSVAIQSFTVKH